MAIDLVDLTGKQNLSLQLHFKHHIFLLNSLMNVVFEEMKKIPSNFHVF
jgi:hypothetical protein